jgi:hypothetical protein
MCKIATFRSGTNGHRGRPSRGRLLGDLNQETCIKKIEIERLRVPPILEKGAVGRCR